MSTRPFVSIIIPAFNVSDYISDTLQSVFEQTFTNYEVILINDGSPDTAKLRAAISSYWDRISYWEQENKGLSGARNKGIELASGNLIAFLDGDDIWLPGFLEAQVRLFEHDQSVDVAWSDGLLFGNDFCDGMKFTDIAPSERPVTLESLLKARSVPLASSVVVRKEAIDEIGGFDCELRRVEDFDAWIRLSLRGKRFLVNPEPLVKYRMRDNSLSADNRAQWRTKIQVLHKIAAIAVDNTVVQSVIAGEVAKLKASLEHEKGRELLDQGKVTDAVDAYRRANDIEHSVRRTFLIMSLRLFPQATCFLRYLNRKLGITRSRVIRRLSR